MIGMGIYQRNGKWWYQRRIKGQLHRWSLDKLGIKSEAQAKAYAREMEKAKLEDHLARLDPSRATLANLKNQFLSERTPFLAPASLERYRVSLDALARDLGESCALRALTERKLSRWAAGRLAQGVSPAGVNSDLRHIKAALRRAARWGMIEKAPTIEMVKEPIRLARHLKPAEIDALLAAETNPERRRLWVFLLWTGCRRSEALNLKWQDIEWSERPSCRVTGKGNRQRAIPLLPAAVEALGLPADLGHVFTFHPWGLVGPNVVSKWFHQLVKHCRLEGVRLHDLRHTCFTYLASKGVPLRMIQAIAGHASIRTTEAYAKGLVADLYDEMAKALAPSDITKVSRDE